MRAYAHRHKHIHIHTPTHTSTTGILRASIPECRDAWRFSLAGGELAIATLGVLTGIPSSSSTLYCYFIPESAVYFVNCFIIILAVPWRKKGDICVHARRETGWAEWCSGEAGYQVAGVTC